MTTITLEEAQAKLPELIEQLTAGEELLITRNASPVAKLVSPGMESSKPIFGRGRGKAVILSEDDDHLQGFEGYMFVTILLDTHTWLWFYLGDSQLSKDARVLIEDPANSKLVSAASCWELAIKVSIGKIRLTEPYDELLQRDSRQRVHDPAN